MTTESPESNTDQEESDTREWYIGPSQAPYWKFWVAGIAFHLFRQSRIAPVLQKLPGAPHIAKWAFKVRVLSRDFTELTDNASNTPSEPDSTE